MNPGIKNNIEISGLDTTYEELLNLFKPRPISSDTQYWQTNAVIDALLSEPELSKDGQSYLHLLSILVEAYDEEQKTIPELRGIELLRSIIEESGLKQRDLLLIFKHESIVSDILNGRRALTVAHIDQLAQYFELPHQPFFEPTKPQTASVEKVLAA